MDNWYYITPAEYEEAEKNGINRNLLNTRVYRNGWNKQKAINKPITRKKLFFSEEDKKIIKENGLNEAQVRSRVNNLGWTKEKAMSVPTKIGALPKYESWVYEKAKANKIPVQTLRNRISQCNWSVEKACTTPIMTHEEVLEMINKNKKKRLYG